MNSLPENLTFEYLKSSTYRTIHADGVYIAAMPNGPVITFYLERPPIPTKVVHKLLEGGRLGEELIEQRAVKASVIREVETSVAFSLAGAKQFVQALTEMIGKMEALGAATEANVTTENKS